MNHPDLPCSACGCDTARTGVDPATSKLVALCDGCGALLGVHRSTRPNAMATALLRALGISDRGVTRIELVADADTCQPLLTVTRVLYTAADVQALETVVQHFVALPVDDAEAVLSDDTQQWRRNVQRAMAAASAAQAGNPLSPTAGL